MQMTAFLSLALGLALAGPGQASQAPDYALRAHRGGDFRWDSGQGVRIDWKDSWQATHEANHPRLAGVTALPWQVYRETLSMPAGEIYLLEALLDRFGGEEGQRIAAYRRLVQLYDQAHLPAKAHDYRRRLIEEFPGRADLAAEALREILGRVQRGYRSPGGQLAQWVEYAAGRVLALRSGGLLADAELAAAALRARAMVRADAHCRFVEAAEDLEALRKLSGGREPPEWLAVEVLALSGHADEAERTRAKLAPARAAEDEKTPAMATEYSRDMGAEIRWQGLRRMPPAEQVAEANTLFAADESGGALVPLDEKRRTTIWALADEYFRSRDAAELAPLRRSGDAEARDAAARAVGGGQFQALMGLYRRRPFSDAAGEALCTLGSVWLRRGQAGLALRCFQDALSHSAGPAVRTEAQVGEWLALSQLPGRRDDLATAMKDIPPGAAFPWMGGTLPAGEIRRRLLDQTAPASPRPEERAGESPSADGAGLRLLAAPAVFPFDPSFFGYSDDPARGKHLQHLWAVRAAGGKVVIAGPNALACYGEDLSRPLWVRRSEPPQAPHPRHGAWTQCPDVADARGDFAFSISGGRVFTRWLHRPPVHCPRTVAAFDLDTGRLLWSADEDPQWEHLLPVTGPTAAEGRVFFLALDSELQFTRMHLVCLDAETGALIWKRLLASPKVEVALRRREFFHQGWVTKVRLISWGNSVTVADGAVYCSTTAGFVARCDARDGAIEWTRGYGQSALPLGYAAGRRGSEPIVSGRSVVFAPRDFAGLMALDRASGQMIWQNLLAPAGEVFARSGRALLTWDDHAVAAVEAETGRLLWHRRFEEGVTGRPAVVGLRDGIRGAGCGTIWVPTPDRLVRLDAETSAVLSERPLAAAGAAGDLASRGGRLVTVSPGAAEVPRAVAPLNPAAPEGAPKMQLPLECAWALHRPGPQILAPPGGARPDGRFLLLSAGVLECLRLSARGGVEWRVAVPPDLLEVLWAGDVLLLVGQEQVRAVDPARGTLLWQRGVPMRAEAAAATGDHVVLAGWAGGERETFFQAAGLEVKTGRLLWCRDVPELRSNQAFLVRPHGKDFRIFVLRGGSCFRVTCRGQDGGFNEVRRIDTKSPHLTFLGASAGIGWFLADGGSAVSIELDAEGEPRVGVHPGDNRIHTPYAKWRLAGPRLGFCGGSGTLNLYDAADPAYRLSDRHVMYGPWLAFDEQRLYKYHEVRTGQRVGQLTVTDLATRRVSGRYDVPIVHYRDECPPLEGWTEAGRLYVLMYRWPLWIANPPGSIFLHVYDQATGQRVGGQELARGFHWYSPLYRQPHQPQFLRAGGLLVVTDTRGVYAFAPAAGGREGEEAASPLPSCGAGGMALDGREDDWDAAATHPLTGPPGGRVHLACDADNVYVGAACPGGRLVPRRGSGPGGGGDLLEVSIRTNAGTYGVTVGMDSAGRVTWERLGWAEMPAGLRAAARCDAAADRRAYELAMPLAGIVDRDSRRNGDRWRSMEVSVLLREDGAGGGGEGRTWTWGKLLPHLGPEAVGRQRVQLPPAAPPADKPAGKPKKTGPE